MTGFAKQMLCSLLPILFNDGIMVTSQYPAENLLLAIQSNGRRPAKVLIAVVTYKYYPLIASYYPPPPPLIASPLIVGYYPLMIPYRA